jgi:hypothetical protein
MVDNIIFQFVSNNCQKRIEVHVIPMDAPGRRSDTAIIAKL